ncbi:unnamed protein product [Boreogadus saida]
MEDSAPVVQFSSRITVQLPEYARQSCRWVYRSFGGSPELPDCRQAPPAGLLFSFGGSSAPGVHPPELREYNPFLLHVSTLE